MPTPTPHQLAITLPAPCPAAARHSHRHATPTWRAALLIASLGLGLGAGCTSTGTGRASSSSSAASSTAASAATLLAAADRQRADQHGVLQGELSLAAAKRLALANHPDPEAALARVQRAMASLARARAAKAPRLDATAGWQHNEPVANNNAALGAFGGAEPSDQYSIGLMATYTLFDWHARDRRIDAARESLDAEADAARDTDRLLAAAVADTWYGVLLAQLQIRIVDSDIAYTTTLLNETRQRRAVGKATAVDELNFQIRLNNAQALRLDALQAWRTTGVALCELLGLPDVNVDTDLHLPAVDLEAPVASPFTHDDALAELVQRAVAARPDLSQLAHQVAAAEARLAAIRAEGKPQITASAGAQLARQDQLPHSDDDLSGTIGLGANYNLFDGGERAAALDETSADLRALQAQLASRRNGLVADLRRRQIEIDLAQQKVALQQSTIALTRQTRDLEKQSYDGGKGTITRLNEVQNDVVNAEIGLVANQVGLLRSLESLDAVLADNLPAAP